MRFLVDTNIFVYAVNRGRDEYEIAARRVEEWLRGSVPWGTTWGIVYEFLRVVTHQKVFSKPLTATRAMEFLDPILNSDLVEVLSPTPRHDTLLRQTIHEFGKPAGNIFHDLSTAVVMREHGVSEIMTADTDFRKFEFLKVTNPLRN